MDTPSIPPNQAYLDALQWVADRLAWERFLSAAGDDRDAPSADQPQVTVAKAA